MVSTETLMPSNSNSFSAASVGPKSGYLSFRSNVIRVRLRPDGCSKHDRVGERPRPHHLASSMLSPAFELANANPPSLRRFALPQTQFQRLANKMRSLALHNAHP